MEVQSFQYSGQGAHLGHLCGVTLSLLLAPWGWQCLVSSLAVMLAHKETPTTAGNPGTSHWAHPTWGCTGEGSGQLQSWSHSGAREFQLDHSDVEASTAVCLINYYYGTEDPVAPGQASFREGSPATLRVPWSQSFLQAHTVCSPSPASHCLLL